MTTYELYGGDIKLDFDEKKHIYTVDDTKVLSVTGITKIIDKSGPLMWWAVDQCLEFFQDKQGPDFYEKTWSDEIARKHFLQDARRAHMKTSRTAADIGSLAHEWIDGFLNGKHERDQLPKNSQARASVQSFVEWFDGNVDEVIDTEFKCYSKENNYAGTADFDGIINGERCIADWKTSKAVYPEYEIQGAGYVIAREEELDVSYDAIWIVALPKDGGKVKAKRFPITQRAQKGFLGALDLYRSLKK